MKILFEALCVCALLMLGTMNVQAQSCKPADCKKICDAMELKNCKPSDCKKVCDAIKAQKASTDNQSNAVSFSFLFDEENVTGNGNCKPVSCCAKAATAKATTKDVPQVKLVSTKPVPSSCTAKKAAAKLD